MAMKGCSGNAVAPALWLMVWAVWLSAAGCSNFEYSPYAADIKGPTGIIEKNVQAITESVSALPFKFAVVSDTHDYNSELREALDSVARRGDVSFVVHAGDMTDVGLPREFMWCRDEMERCGIPYVTVPGNHDCLGNGEDSYSYIFGARNYSFTVAGVHFVCLNTNALEYDYSEPVPDLGFIEEDARRAAAGDASAGPVTHTVVVMHSRPFDEQFNNNVARAFRYYLGKYPGMEAGGAEAPSCARGFCINGHNHSFQVKDLFEDGLLFYQADAISKRSFLVFTITADGYEMERVCF